MKKFYSLFSILVVLSFFIGFSFKPNPSRAQVPALPSDIDLEQCALDLTEYMNTALDGIRGETTNIVPVSISWNMTSPFEDQLFTLMEEAGAKFDELDYFTGNTYTVNGKSAYEWYATHYTWKQRFASYGKPLIVTEFGDFATRNHAFDASQPLIDTMKEDLAEMISGGGVFGINYFSALPADVMGGANPEFAFHNLSLAELTQVISGNNAITGLNPGVIMGGATNLNEVLTSLGMKWTVALITGPDVTGTANFVTGLPAGVNPVIRMCYGSSCGFKNPLVLVDFIKALDPLVDRKTYFIIGPNEPLTDPWVSEACGAAADRIWEWQRAQCGDKLDPEFHSLRPYPGNLCPENPENPVQKVLMCGNQITAAENYTIKTNRPAPYNDINLEAECERLEPIRTPVRFVNEFGTEVTEIIEEDQYLCENVDLKSSVYLTIDLTDTELPVLGNTEDVPNALSGTNSLSFANRMNNYVSWYLQGVFQTGEEEFASSTDPQGLRNMLDFAGPIQKLLPQDILRRQWAGNETIDLGDSHDQIVVCKQGFPEACYIDDSQSRVRKSAARGNPYSVDASYIPLSTTEDEKGQIRILNASLPGVEEGNDLTIDPTVDVLENSTENPRLYPGYPDPGAVGTPRKNYDMLFFPHARESVQLADILQRTYVPQDALKTVVIEETLYTPNPACASPTGIILCGLGIEPWNFVNEIQYVEDRNNWIDSDDRMPPIEEVEFDYNGKYCQVLNAYENPGDNLYGWLTDTDFGEPRGTENYVDQYSLDMSKDARNITAELTYDGSVECEFQEVIPSQCYIDCRVQTRTQCMPDYECEYFAGSWDPAAPGCGPAGFVNCNIRYNPEGNSPEKCMETCNEGSACQVTAMVSGQVEVESPWVESIFKRLVNGGMSIYRRIYPRLAANNRNLPTDQQIVVPGPEKFVDIPAKGTAEYETTNLSGGIEYQGGKALAGNPLDGKSTGDVYFPLLGSVHEYFFDDIQTALRPYGFNNSFMSPGEDSQCSLENTVIQSSVLEGIIAAAANWAHVPTDVLIAVVRGEGCGGGDRVGGICQYTDEQVTQFSAAGARDPRNCLPRGRASGPLQIYFDSVNWDPWKDAVNMGTGENRTPEICNIKDSVYAAAYILSAYYDGCANANHDVNNTPTNWSETDKQRALTGWAQGCSAQLCSGVAGGFYCQKLDEWAGQTSPGQCEESGEEGTTESEESLTQ